MTTSTQRFYTKKEFRSLTIGKLLEMQEHIIICYNYANGNRKSMWKTRLLKCEDVIRETTKP
jgi:hypothetical protein